MSVANKLRGVEKIEARIMGGLFFDTWKSTSDIHASLHRNFRKSVVHETLAALLSDGKIEMREVSGTGGANRTEFRIVRKRNSQTHYPLMAMCLACGKEPMISGGKICQTCFDNEKILMS
jgi:hypothetical protein